MKKFSHNLSKVSKLPKDTPFVQLPKDLLASPSWRFRSINCRRLIDFLMVEHMNHAGLENGNLFATYDQLEKWGIPRRYIHKAITEAERLGLLLAERGGRKGCVNHVSVYTLTFFPAKYMEDDIFRGYHAPTNDWKSVTKEEAMRVVKNKNNVTK